ncbi:hypothetical protein ABPG75_007194 [Micractinium tetrahymenae]
MTSAIRAGLTAVDRSTQAALEEAGRRTPSDFLLLPETSRTSSLAGSASSLAETLPQVWQDLFAATRAAQSTDYLDRLACSAGVPASEAYRRDCAAFDDPSLGITRDTVFTQFLCPEALVQQHRLGPPQVRRLYQALQVYSLGFHQMCVELTAHAASRGLLLLAIWRGFAMLWDGALQVVFPAETVQASRERQAALLMSEQLLERTREAEARTAELEQENAALRAQMDSMAVQVLSAQADLAVATQGAGGLERELKAARREAAAAGEREHAARLELLQLQDKLAALSGPQEELFTRSQQLERLLKEKQTQLSAAAKQAAGVLAGKEEARQAMLAERLRREAAEQKAAELQADLERTREQLQAATAAAAASAQAAAAEATARKRQVEADAAAREDDTARIATERASWQRSAVEAEATVAALRQQLAAVQAAAAAEKERCEQLSASLWPLAARVKALEAAAAAAAAGAGGGASAEAAAADTGAGGGAV